MMVEVHVTGGYSVARLVLPQLGSTRVNSASQTLSESRLDQPSACSWRLGSAQQST